MSAIASAAAALNRHILGPEGLRFGSFPFRVDHFVVMPEGLLGFRGFHDFALITPYELRLAPYKLLQSLKSHKVSFIVTELGNAGVSIAPKDLKELASAAGLRVEQAIFLLIVSVRYRPDGLVTTVNLRAPIVLDPKTRVARQCVTSKAEYQVQQPLFGHASTALGA